MLDNTMDTLRILADETDGRAIVNTNDLDRGLRQIVRDSSAYYLLGYTSAVTTDGKFHKINVRVKRPGLQVRARPGYLALSAAEAERALAPKKPGPPPAITEALGTLAATAQQRRNLIRSWIGMSPGADGKTKISFVWNPAPAVPGVRREAAATRVAARRRRELGSVLSREGASRRAASSSKCRRDRSSWRSRSRMRLAKCSIAKRERSIVPSLGLGLTLSTPEVFRGRTLPEWQALAADARRDAGRSSVNSAAPIGCSCASARRAPAARPC